MSERNDEQGVEYHLRKAGQLLRDVIGRRAAAEYDVARLKDLLAKRDAECANLRSMIDRIREEMAALQSEREPVDNGDGTETKLLPVTYPKGVPVECARAPKKGDRYFGDGDQFTAVDDHRQERIRLILRHAPKPTAPATWEAPLADGDWFAQELTFSTDAGRIVFTWTCTGEKIRGITKPAKLGRYQFVNGIGTLIEEAK